jgi:hypothetical protein
VTISNKQENLQLPDSEIVVAHMLGEAGRHFGRNVPPTVVHRSDDA